ncbi:probable beta-D-xylosidase 2 [Podarcis lilfordi]|uniref:Probable beta-D-xylosidase 2 n=1 Tax=Podarcis lilfordi TaxID=74358 RepID=A0AA35KP17_9SAUR|nr:probable beta-D-xylosidase 2 [Podarcis lilfordi]
MSFLTSSPLLLLFADSPELIYRVANATATEVRAKHNYFISVGNYDDHTGLSCFSPMLNIMRHPLWGRNQETYGEDPFLTRELGVAFVTGLQGDHPRYIKASAGCKHFSVHGGPENIPEPRYSFDAKVEERDWRMTFLPQFEACVRAGTFSFMCSYNRINGIPACANKNLLTDILRGEWGFQGYVVSDEGAVELLWLGHNYTHSLLESAIASVNAGCNLEVSYGMVNNSFTFIGQAVAKGNISLEVVGPFADNPRVLFGNYAPVPEPQYIYTPRRGLATIAANVTFAAGCTFPTCSTYMPAQVKAAVEAADIVVVCLGTGMDLETETKDRKDLALPGHQLELLQDAVAWAAGRPVILLLFNAGPLDVSWAKAQDSVGAILACFYPAQATGLALAKVLVGAKGANPAGRLPATWPAGMHQVPPMENYTMVGRTYRYYGDEAPLYPFGYGLSFTTFQYSDLVLGANVVPICGNLSISAVVKNVGSRDGEEVVQLCLRWGGASVPVPRWQLVGFHRVPVPVGRAVKVPFQLDFSQRAIWAGEWRLEPGTFTLFVGGQQPFQETRAPSNILQADFTVSGKACRTVQC